MIENNVSECKDWLTQCDPEHMLPENTGTAYTSLPACCCWVIFLPLLFSLQQVIYPGVNKHFMGCRAQLAWNAYSCPLFSAVILTHKVGQTGLVFGMRSRVVSRSAHTKLQVSVCSMYKLNLSFTKTFKQADPGYRQSGLFVVTWPYDWSIDWVVYL